MTPFRFWQLNHDPTWKGHEVGSKSHENSFFNNDVSAELTTWSDALNCEWLKIISKIVENGNTRGWFGWRAKTKNERRNTFIMRLSVRRYFKHVVVNFFHRFNDVSFMYEPIFSQVSSSNQHAQSPKQKNYKKLVNVCLPNN